eukprot:767168-Hanusia_phi.AAC.3
MCIQTFNVSRSALIASANPSSALQFCMPLPTCSGPEVFPSSHGPEQKTRHEAEDVRDHEPVPEPEDSSISEQGKVVERHPKLSLIKQKQVEALSHSIAYIQKLQAEAGGSVDGTRVPCASGCTVKIKQDIVIKRVK